MKILVRVKPFAVKNDDECAICVVENDTLMISQTADEDFVDFKKFSVDSVLGPDCTQDEVHDQCVDVAVKCVEGHNGSIFMYGQTGAGKTFTLRGGGNESSSRGVLQHAFNHVFRVIELLNVKCKVTASYVELYNEQIRDLQVDWKSNKESIKIRFEQHGTLITGLTQTEVHSSSDMEQVLVVGERNRLIGNTMMGMCSSRAHQIFTITLEFETPSFAGTTRSTLHLIDMAGCERAKKTGVSGALLKEAANISKSLSSFANVMTAMYTPVKEGQRKNFVPYRDSKITMILKDSLESDNCVMCICLNPSSNCYDESISVLRMGSRIKKIRDQRIAEKDPLTVIPEVISEVIPEVISVSSAAEQDTVKAVNEESEVIRTTL